MSKSHRGKGIQDKPNGGRGKCPRCQREGVKILYDQEIDGAKTQICKICKAAIKNGKAV